jgi:restriction system protein
MITNAIPQTWQDLQQSVGRILMECGFAVETEKVIASPRGSVEIDVYAEENINGRRYALACECKHWGKRIPQTVVHAFRTVVAEVGANVGYLVSLEGFQSGSLAASEMTNLQLVTWQEFQLLFEESWFEAFFVKEVDRRLDALMTYAEPFLPAWWDNMLEEDQRQYMALKERHDLFGVIAQSLGPYTRMLRPNEPLPKLPLRGNLLPDPLLESVPNDVLDATAYRELLDAAILHGEAAISEFRVLQEPYAAQYRSRARP